MIALWIISIVSLLLSLFCTLFLGSFAMLLNKQRKKSTAALSDLSDLSNFFQNFTTK